jgi:hypothetical protein
MTEALIMPADLQQGFEMNESDFEFEITPFWSRMLERLGLGATFETMQTQTEFSEEPREITTLAKLHPPDDRYIGERDKNERAHGYGHFSWDDGSRYHGEWKNGLRHGKGMFVEPDGRVYKGFWVDDMRDGIGKT